uniref:WD repeat-containing protein 55 homolog n=1 Tax=Cacopsylla melanoneura TaxID=428564 RepID=A0A8D8TAU1_9HEMI
MLDHLGKGSDMDIREDTSSDEDMSDDEGGPSNIFDSEFDSSDVSLTSDSDEDDDDEAIDADSNNSTEAEDPEEKYAELMVGRENNTETTEEDDVVKAIKKYREMSKAKKLTEIKCKETIYDISFHTGENLIAAADITGDIKIYSYSEEDAELKTTLEIHTDSCRSIEFFHNGDTLLSGSKDHSIAIHDVATEKLTRYYETAHADPVNKVAIISEHIFASGTDNGEVKIWDVRSKEKEVFQVKGMDDFVTSMTSTDKHKYLACTCGDGSVVSINLTARKLHIQSEFYKAELTCSGVVKQDTKLACGASDGCILLYNWGEFGTSSDIIAKYGPKKVAINCMVPITDKIVACGYENGEIRATSAFPMQHLGVIGQHSMSVEALDISHDGEYIASASLDNTISFWAIEYFENIRLKTEKVTVKEKQKKINHNLPSSKFGNASDFFSGLA